MAHTGWTYLQNWLQFTDLPRSGRMNLPVPLNKLKLRGPGGSPWNPPETDLPAASHRGDRYPSDAPDPTKKYRSQPKPSPVKDQRPCAITPRARPSIARPEKRTPKPIPPQLPSNHPQTPRIRYTDQHKDPHRTTLRFRSQNRPYCILKILDPQKSWKNKVCDFPNSTKSVQRPESENHPMQIPIPAHRTHPESSRGTAQKP